MTTAFKLSLPTDIPWERVCVTEDMLDRVVCDVDLPPKWQSSIAVFQYVPADEYQLFPAYKITYLKVTATITGYQPLDDEIQGEIDWDGVNIETIDGLTELLSSYYPCTGAMLQIVVGPPGRDPHVPLKEYPFFLDFEPKKRELYELATDTKEKQSRSIETLNVSKSAGTTQSLEVMDVDMGGGGFGMQSTYAGTGGGFNVQAGQGQWGTKTLNTDQSLVDRTTESGTEKRETFSHTTQLSQLYHLLNSYHVGTNRGVFFVLPRPHTVEEPSGFVRGPRKVEGVQEFFLVVAQPKDAPYEKFCLAVRLDTSHLVETDILEYDYRTDSSELASANPAVPTKNDTYYATEALYEACAGWCWDVYYKCYYSSAVDDRVYAAPDGYVIESHNDLVNQTQNQGFTSVSIAPGRKNLTVHAEAVSYRCFEDTGVCANCPDATDTVHGTARRQVQVNLRSEEPIIKVGTQQQLLITTRGLCCCPEGPVEGGVKIIGSWSMPDELGGRVYIDPSVRVSNTKKALPESSALSTGFKAKEIAAGGKVEEKSCSCARESAQPSTSDREQTGRRIQMRQANAINEFIRTRMIESLRDPRPGHGAKSFLETDIFARQLEAYVRRTRVGYGNLRKSARRVVPESVLNAVAKRFGLPPDKVKVSDVLRLTSIDYLRLAKISPAEVAQIKMALLGVKRSEAKRKPKQRRD